MISYEDFQKIDLRVATILAAEKLEGSEKLIKLQIDLGQEIGERQILAGMAKVYTPEQLVARQIVVVANLEPRQMMGQESQGMLLAAHGPNGQPILLTPDSPASAGSKIS
jgi:methionyl-tRNA synthetase